MTPNLKSRSFYSLFATISWFAIAGTGLAADLPNGSSAEVAPVNDRINRAWEFVIAPYFIAANITGSTQVGRLPSTDIDVGTSDILENIRFGFMGRAEALYQHKFGAMLDVAYMNLGTATDTPGTGGRVRVGGSQLILETMLYYRAHSTNKTKIDVYAGGRYWDIGLDLNATGTVAGDFNISSGAEWLDPVIGVRAVHRFADKWTINGRGDIGGFGAGSDFSWNLQAGVGYHFNDIWSTQFQYKVLSVDYDNGKTGTGRFAYDALTHGPLLGIVARF
ncbi:hypothetical protein LP7551_01482 [Roseibium album]|nr:hypothetical protein LP7551_01482 [Roseibium album]